MRETIGDNCMENVVPGLWGRPKVFWRLHFDLLRVFRICLSCFEGFRSQGLDMKTPPSQVNFLDLEARHARLFERYTDGLLIEGPSAAIESACFGLTCHVLLSLLSKDSKENSSLLWK